MTELKEIGIGLFKRASGTYGIISQNETGANLQSFLNQKSVRTFSGGHEKRGTQFSSRIKETARANTNYLPLSTMKM